MPSNSAWIESHSSVWNQRETFMLQRKLGFTDAHGLFLTVGILHRFWHFAANCQQNGEFKDYTPEDLARAIGWPGNPKRLWDALHESGFLTREHDIPNWSYYFALENVVPIPDAPASALATAKSALRQWLSGPPLPASEMLARAESEGISSRTLMRAKAELGIRSIKNGMQAGWLWFLPKTARLKENGDLQGESLTEAKDAKNNAKTEVPPHTPPPESNQVDVTGMNKPHSMSGELSGTLSPPIVPPSRSTRAKPNKPKLAAPKRVTEVDDAFIDQMVERYGAKLGGRQGIIERIEEAEGHRNWRIYHDRRAYARKWLRREAGEDPTALNYHGPHRNGRANGSAEPIASYTEALSAKPESYDGLPF